jgi:superfamily II DNA or RNA helicase
MTATELRDYQIKAVENIEREMLGKSRHVLFVLPTGGGKTEIAKVIAENAVVGRGERVLFLTHRREILRQTSRKLSFANLDHGLIQAGLNVDLEYPIQVASIQTFWQRCMRTNKLPLPAINKIIIDECHHTVARTWRLILEAYPNARRLGLTATPTRGDGRGLGDYFDVLIEGPSVAELTPKWLVPVIYYAPSVPDLKGVKVQAGDYQINALSKRMNRKDLVGDIISTWFKFGQGRKTICFAVDVGHSVSIRDEFVKAGVRCEHLDAKTPKPDRDDILDRLASGETQIITNCMVLGEGFDCPIASCIILARPTRQLGLYRQMAGRGLRPAEGKNNLVLIDHSGAVYKHGLLEDPIVWSLSTDKRAENPTHAKRSVGIISRLVECSQCSAMRTAGEKCPHCGFLPQRRPDPVVFRPGELARVDQQTRQAVNVFDPAERERWHAMLNHIGTERGYKPGWAAHKYKEKFGAWPPWGSSPQPIPPTPEVFSWVRSRLIAYAFAKRGAA